MKSPLKKGLGDYIEGKKFSLKSGNTPDKGSFFKSPLKQETTAKLVDVEMMADLPGAYTGADPIKQEDIDPRKTKKKKKKKCKPPSAGCGEGLVWSSTACACVETTGESLAEGLPGADAEGSLTAGAAWTPGTEVEEDPITTENEEVTTEENDDAVVENDELTDDTDADDMGGDDDTGMEDEEEDSMAEYKRSGFKMRSGNSPLFKMMGSHKKKKKY